MTRALPHPKPRAFKDMDLPRLARLLDASSVLGPCRDLASLGTTLFKLLREELPVDRLALWFGDASEGLEVIQWAAQLGPDGVLTPLEPVPGLVTHTRNLQEDLWSMEEAGAKACSHPVTQDLMRDYPALVLLPLRTPDRLVGGISMASRRKGAFQAAGSTYLVFLARFLASFALRILRHRQLDALNLRLTQERDQQRVLLEINNELVEHREPRALFQAISSTLRRHFQYDGMMLVLAQDETYEARIQYLDFPSGRGAMQENQFFTVPDGPSQRAMDLRQALVFSRADLDSFPAPIPQVIIEGEGLLSLCVLPLISRSRVMGTLNFGSRQEGAFPAETMAQLSSVTGQVAIALDNAFAYQEIQTLRDKLAEEKLYLQEEMGRDFGMEIVGRSPSLQRVLRQVETVAPSDATVLIMGETGTGKELVARAIHQLSPRKDRGFVQINCASIPAGLVESELFGFEKGAFTGALNQKMGRLELANQGTLFLDEIGDLPLELQPKLLRVIQERQFERLGSTRTQRVDLRLITATNRDLAAMVQDRSFRADLFYRLNVFPIHVPALRERQEDIPVLVRYFTQKFAQSMHRPIESIPTRAMEALQAWHWPGNIRELENVIERSVLLSQGRELQVPVAELRDAAGSAPAEALPTLEQAEREHILKALGATGGKVGGKSGAAARLGLKRTTLQSRMAKLGI
ncbi:MAG: sigma 54-interacting transcriptional regulator [Holophaga sp.]|nr:sigma 54-interacting transcriptional regulator [Holophaga sp.]